MTEELKLVHKNGDYYLYDEDSDELICRNLTRDQVIQVFKYLTDVCEDR